MPYIYIYIFNLWGRGVGGALEGAELTVYDLQNGLSATENSGAQGAKCFQGGTKVSKKKAFWG